MMQTFDATFSDEDYKLVESICAVLLRRSLWHLVSEHTERVQPQFAGKVSREGRISITVCYEWLRDLLLFTRTGGPSLCLEDLNRILDTVPVDELEARWRLGGIPAFADVRNQLTPCRVCRP